MAEATVDRLQIEIDASAKSAGETIDGLIENVKTLQDALKTSFDTKKLKATVESLSDFQEKIKDVGKNLTFKGNFTELNQEIEKVEGRLDKLLAKEEKFKTVGGNENTTAYKNLQYDIAEACNYLDTLYEKQEQLAAETPTFTVNGMPYEEWAAQLEHVQEEAETAGEDLRNIGESVNVSGVAASAESIRENLKGVRTDAEQAEESLEDVGNGGALSGLIERLRSISASDAFGKLSQGIKDFQSKVGIRVPTQEYEELSQKIEQAEAALQKLLDKQDRMEFQGISESSSSWKGLQYDIRVATDRVADFRRDLELLQESGGDTQRLYSFVDVLKEIGAMAGGTVKTALSGCAGVIKKVGSAAKTMATKAGTAVKALSKLATQANLGGGFMSGLSSKIKAAGTALQGLSKKLSTVTRLFSVMLLRRAITALFNELGTAFEHLAQKSDTVNSRISELMSACSQFSHQVAALASPLLDIFGPALTKIINLLSTATSYINQFLSALTGKTFISAKKVATDYAASLSDVGDSASSAAKEIKDATTGIDELNIISQNEDSTSGSGSSGADGLEDCYEELAINSKILEMVEKLKALLEELFEPMKQSWDDYGAGVVDAFQYAVSSIWQLIKDMAATWKEVWTNGSGYELCSNILLLLTSMLNWIGDIATAWDEAWKIKGEDYVQSVFDKLNAILSLIYTISESFRTAFNSGSGVEMIEHIYQIMTNCNNVVANLCNNFKAAWIEAGTGDGIAQTLFDIFNSILGTIENITGSTSEWAANLNFSPLLTSIRNLLDKIKPLVDTIGDALSWVWENVALPLGTWLVESAIPSVIDAIAAAFDALNSIFQTIQPVFEWIWNHMLEPLAAWTGGTIIEIIEGIAGAFRGISEVFKMIADGEDWGEIGTYIWEGLINGITGAASWVWEKLKEIFWGIVDFVKELFGIHSPSTVFAEIGENLIDGLYEGISGAWSKISDFFTSAWDGVKDVFSSAWSVIKSGVTSAWTGIKTTFSESWETVKSGTSTAWENVKSVFSSSWEIVKTGVTNSWETIRNKFSESWRTVGNNTSESWNTIKAAFESAWSNITTGVKNAWLTITQNFTSSWTTVKNGVSESWNTIKASFESAWSTITTGVKNAWTSIEQAFTSGWSTVRSGVSEAWTAIKSAFSSGMSEAKSAVDSGWSTIKESFNSGVSAIQSIISGVDWSSIGGNIITGIGNGISDGWSWLTNKVQSLASSLYDAACDALDINSPSRKFFEIGQYVVAGLNQGIGENGSSTIKYINDWVGSFENIQADIGVKFNVNEQLADYTPNYDTGFDAGTITRMVQEQINTSGVIKANVDASGVDFREIIEDAVIPYLERISDATQATSDGIKEGRKVSVQIDGREVVKATDKVKNNNGFSFSPALT